MTRKKTYWTLGILFSLFGAIVVVLLLLRWDEQPPDVGDLVNYRTELPDGQHPPCAYNEIQQLGGLDGFRGRKTEKLVFSSIIEGAAASRTPLRRSLQFFCKRAKMI